MLCNFEIEKRIPFFGSLFKELFNIAEADSLQYVSMH